MSVNTVVREMSPSEEPLRIKIFWRVRDTCLIEGIGLVNNKSAIDTFVARGEIGTYLS